jgi:hypothetical protein
MDDPVFHYDADEIIDYVADMARQLAEICRRDFDDVALLLAITAERAERRQRERRTG